MVHIMMKGMYTTVGDVEIPVLTCVGSAPTISAAADLLARMTAGQPLPDTYVFHEVDTDG